jgi:N-methylhydantoinase A/acetophenone carboxylase
MSYTIDIDTGGTFTDGFFVCGTKVETVKVFTTPHDLTICLIECIKAGAGRFGVQPEDMLMDTNVIRFSTTIGTNTLIERNGTRIGLLVSKGEENGLQVIDSDESPFVFEEMVRPLEGVVDRDGNEIEPLDRERVLRAAQELLDLGARCLVVSFANSAYNPSHERQARTWIKEEYPRDYLGSVPVFLASDITNLPGDQERTNTTVVNAYIHARLVKFLYKAGEELRKRFYSHPLLIVHATGGVARVAKTKSINTYNSGPSAGLMGVSALSRLYGIKHLVSGDMGGTSFDIGIVHNGQPNFTLKPVIEDIPLNTPMLAIKAIGAGGGSIASVKKGQLQVGPQSAGALPGPACFNIGGTNATTTDADVVLGYINPDNYLGGTVKLDTSKAINAIETNVALPLKMDSLGAALAIRDKIDKYIGEELRNVIASGVSKFEPILVIYGGAGSTHCCGLASYAGIKKIIAPQYASVFSANSLSSMDIWHIYSKRLGIWLKKSGRIFENGKVITDVMNVMHAEALRDMRGEGFGEDEVAYEVEFFLSKGNNVPEGRVVLDILDWKEGLTNIIENQKVKIFNEPDVFSPVMLLHATAKIPHYETTKHDLRGTDSVHAQVGTRPVCFDGAAGMVETRIYDRGLLEPGNVVKGPAIVEAADTTYVVRESWEYTIDAYGNGVFKEVTA